MRYMRSVKDTIYELYGFWGELFPEHGAVADNALWIVDIVSEYYTELQ